MHPGTGADRQGFPAKLGAVILKIYEVDPLVCPKCSGAMRVIAFIEDPNVIKKILKHLGLWGVKRKPRPTANAPPARATVEVASLPGSKPGVPVLVELSMIAGN